MQKIRLILILCLLALSVTGCGQVFIDKDKMYEIVRYDSGDLENNVLCGSHFDRVSEIKEKML